MYRLILATCILLLHSGMYKEPLAVFYKDVEVDGGPVRGFLAEDGEYFAFLGIPYAAPPLGSRRFKAPLPPAPWKERFLANRTVICPQRGEGEEDCLIVNVFTPITIAEPLPVLVYYHGGSFLMGFGQTKGFEPLIKQNVIVVTLNYRLGVLGFLCLGTEDAPGNAGLKDHVEALRWVQRNIGRFGGDPKKVTVFGMSSAGMTVEMLVLSSMASGLFHRAIIESGTSQAICAMDTDPIKTAKQFASYFPNETQSQLIQFYQNAPALEMSVESYKYYQDLIDGTFGFAPCLENELSEVERFQWLSPQDMLRKDLYNRVPLMFIFAENEGLFLRSLDYYDSNYKDRMNAQFQDFMPGDLVFDTEEISKVAENVRRFYFGDKKIDENTLTGYFNYFADHFVLHGLLNSVVDHAKKGDVVYLMEFAHKGTLGTYDPFFDSVQHSAGHGDAIKYTIIDRANDFKSLPEDDKLIVRRMVELVTNFMKYGNPTPSRSELIPVLWPAVQNDSVAYLHLGKDLQVSEKPCWERKLFWDKLYDKYRKPIKSGPEYFEFYKDCNI